jgi:hypothetical protein
MKRLDIQPGTIFNKLEFIEYGQKKELPCGQKVLTANCKCECGNIKENILVLHLVRNRIKSCGCLNPIHNMTRTKLHTTWRAMCNRVRETYFEKKYYFDKGITLFEDWKDFRNFRDWAFLNNYVDGLQIDRIDNSKGYCPDNCRFVTQEENLSNRDITKKYNYKGEYLSIAQLARKYNKNYDTVYTRVKNGKSIEYAIETPVRQFKTYDR